MKLAHQFHFQEFILQLKVHKDTYMDVLNVEKGEKKKYTKRLLKALWLMHTLSSIMPLRDGVLCKAEFEDSLPTCAFIYLQTLKRISMHMSLVCMCL